MDNNFKRSAYVSVSGYSSTFMDWDGKTYGSQPSDAAIYFYDVGFSCDHWCPLVLDEMCDEAEAMVFSLK